MSQNNRDFQTIMEDIKQQLRERRGCSVKQLTRCFRKSQRGIDGIFEFEDWSDVLNQAGIFLKTQDLKRVFKGFAYEKNGTHVVNYRKFLEGIARGRLHGRRSDIAQKAWLKFDKLERGIVPLKDLSNAYDPGTHPRVLTGDLKEEQAFKEFVSHFDGSRNTTEKKKRTEVAKEDFMSYMAELSSFFPSSDNDFVNMMQKAWKVRETVTKEMKEMDKKRLDFLKDQIREKVRQRTKCSKFENITLYRACKNFDLDDSGDIDSEEFALALNTLGIHLPEHELEALFNSFGLSEFGTITYWNFSHSLFKNTEPDISTSMTKTIGRKGPVESGPAKARSPVARHKVPSWALKHAKA